MTSHTVKHVVAAAGALGALLLAAPSYAQTGPVATKEPAMTSIAEPRAAFRSLRSTSEVGTQ